MKNNKYRSAIKVALIYLTFSTLWIVFSDYLLLLVFEDVEQYRNVSTYKGLFFILISALIIYKLVQHEVTLLRKMYTRVEDLENYDQLTGTYNRQRFLKEVDRISQEKEEVSVLMTDINGLKLINEMYSSEEGDKVLRLYTEFLRDILPENAFISRIGGDEFCCILYGCDFKDVQEYANKVHDEVTKQKIQHLDCSVAMGYSSNCNVAHDIYDAVSLAEDRLIKNKLLLAKSASNSIVTTLKTTLFERSDETEQHATRMQELCTLIGKELGLFQSDIDDLQLLAILHDIGKIGIDDQILKKPGPLTETEYTKMKQHPMIGFKIASSVAQLEGISYFILTHHERWDGSGYPKGIKGTEIPIASRILSIVDAYDAMTNDRVYRQKVSHPHAMEEIIRNKGTQFDPKIVDVFVTIMKNHSSSE